MNALSFMTHSGSSPGAAQDSFVCSGSSPQHGSVRPTFTPASAARLPENQSDPRLEYLMEESYRAGVCIHEAAHAEYMERIGDVYVEFIPLPNEEQFKYCDALVTNHATYEQDVAQAKANPLGYLKSILAAGIAEELLTRANGAYCGTAFDEEETEEMFDALGIRAEERKRILKQAHAEILKDLRSPAFRKALWARARFFQRILEREIFEQQPDLGQPRRGGARRTRNKEGNPW